MLFLSATTHPIYALATSGDDPWFFQGRPLSLIPAATTTAFQCRSNYRPVTLDSCSMPCLSESQPSRMVPAFEPPVNRQLLFEIPTWNAKFKVATLQPNLMFEIPPSTQSIVKSSARFPFSSVVSIVCIQSVTGPLDRPEALRAFRHLLAPRALLLSP